MGSVLFILRGKETWNPYKIRQLLWFREAEWKNGSEGQPDPRTAKQGHVLIT